LLAVADHMPPAFSQSARFVYRVKSELVPGGLAAGELDEPPDAPGAVLVPGVLTPEPELPVVPEGPVEPAPPVVPPAPPVVPEGALEPELPGEPVPPPVCAAAIAGARAMIPIKSASISFCMVNPPVVVATGGAGTRHRSNIWADRWGQERG
jgi:hypothetical protein